MALVTSTRKCSRRHTTAATPSGAFNVNNMEIVRGITEACKEECNAPVILQVSKGARAYAKPHLPRQARRGGCH